MVNKTSVAIAGGLSGVVVAVVPHFIALPTDLITKALIGLVLGGVVAYVYSGQMESNERKENFLNMINKKKR